MPPAISGGQGAVLRVLRSAKAFMHSKIAEHPNEPEFVGDPTASRFRVSFTRNIM